MKRQNLLYSEKLEFLRYDFVRFNERYFLNCSKGSYKTIRTVRRKISIIKNSFLYKLNFSLITCPVFLYITNSRLQNKIKSKV